MVLTDQGSANDGGSDIEVRSVHDDNDVGADADGGYELPPPMTESEGEDDDDIPILAASEVGGESEMGTDLFRGLPPVSMMEEISSMMPPSTTQAQARSHAGLMSEISLPPYDAPTDGGYDPIDPRDGPAGLTELETAGHTLSEILAIDKFRRWIARDYQRFLTTFTDDQGHSVYHGRIRAMCAANLESLEVSYVHLMEANAFLAKLVANCPAETLAIFDEATMRIVLRLFEEYDKIRSEIHVRITDFPSMDQLRDLRYNHLNTLIKVSGVVTRRSGVFPQLKLVRYDCNRCGAVLGPFVQDLQAEVHINACTSCDSRGPFSINTSQTVYRNYQKVTLQEAPGSVPAGRLPRHKEVILLWDLIDSARPGELIEVTGIYRNNFSYALNTKNGFPVFQTVIEANWVCKHADQFSELRLTEEDQREIRRLAEDPMIGLRIIRSIAPSIHGCQDIKTAIALSLFGGEPKNVQGKHPIRGDINVLLLGDPGMAKSQFLKYVEKTAQRAVYTTGQGASAVGLTASVRKDPVTREWTLEGGALVLADKGTCLIDEFDKMNDADRTSIHEAMEQQSISVSKAGIITTLQARCAIIAAANPLRGRYNTSLPFSQNVQLTEPILSRFDVLCVVKDLVDPVADERLARFVVGSHIRSHPTGLAHGGTDGTMESLADDLQYAAGAIEPIPQDMLRKYIFYARNKCHPALSHMDVDKISRLYADLRKESLASGSIPITVRHIESMVRMAEAHAKMHLRDHVRADDIDLAIRVALESFIQSQKYSVMNHLRKSFSKYISYRRDHYELLSFLLLELGRDAARLQGSPTVDAALFEARSKELHIHDLKPFYGSRAFQATGYRLDPARNRLVKPE